VAEPDDMLRIIHHTDSTASQSILRLEGRIVGPWVDELRRAYVERTANSPCSLTIDLRDVTFIDSGGIAFFDEIYLSVTLINCSLFALEQLKAVMERHDGVRM
jgi:anti-anti-sigma regulatory factor